MIKAPSGQGYVAFLQGLHASVLFDWYIEIGCRNGRMFAPVRGKTIAVDPYFRAELNIIGKKPALHVFQEKSDDFFASGFLPRNDIRLSFGFIDGMHLFEYLLRDFMNFEAHAAEGAVVAFHDCCPYTTEMAGRDLDNLPKEGGWTGDVWKILPTLRDYRPDLKVTVLDARPTGLVLVSGLTPGNRGLQENYTEIVQRFEPVTLESFGIDAYNSLFDFTDPRVLQKDGYALFDAIKLDPANALRPTFVSP